MDVLFVSFALLCATSLLIVGYTKKNLSENTSAQRDASRSRKDATFKESSGKQPEFSKVFNDTFLELAAFVIRSDNDIAYSELQCVKKYFRTYYPGNEERYFERLNLYLKKDININNACKVILDAGFNDKFQMMSQLFTIASADGYIYISEYVALHDIFDLLGLPNMTFITIRGLFGVSYTHKEVDDFKKQSFRKEMDDWRREFERQRQEERKQQQYKKKQQSYNNYYYQQKSKKETYSKKAPSKLDTAYTILGIKKGTSLNQIKKAYRKLAHQHHPDKVAHLGEGSVKQAEAVFRKIKDAYELIVKALK